MGEKAKIRCYWTWGVGGGGGEGSECSGRPFFIILLKKIGFAP